MKDKLLEEKTLDCLPVICRQVVFGFSRGYFHLFYAPYEVPVLIGMISGEAAYKADKIGNPDTIVEDAMSLLKKLFGDDCPKEVSQFLDFRFL